MKPVTYYLLFSIFTFFTSLNSFAQMKNYDAAWTKVEELVQKKNLPQSALTEVKKIYTQAKKISRKHR
jgi:uncharacterized BrkB/YihY/UPF0761 family membrane protein